MKFVIHNIARYALLFTCVGGLLAGCVVAQVRPLSDDRAATYVAADHPENGYVIGSFSASGFSPKYSNKFQYGDYSVYLRQIGDVDKPITGRVFFDTRRKIRGVPNLDFEVEEGRGNVFVMPMPAGNYEFYSFRLHYADTFGEKNWTSVEEFSIPFNVVPGEALYIGEIRVTHQFAKSVSNTFIPDGGTFTCLEQFERDVPLVHAEYPFVRPFEVVNRPMCERFEQVNQELATNDGRRAEIVRKAEQ